MPSLQKKLRDLERTIKKNGSTPDLEKRRKDLEIEKNGKQRKEKEKKIAEKYHMVKFVERQKLVRKIRSVRSKIIDASDNTEAIMELQATEANLIDDLCYVMYYPKDMKYIALFSKQHDIQQSDDSQKNKDKINSLKQNALKLAKESRQKDNDAGYEDRVQHAIDVEFNTASTTNTINNNNHSRTKPYSSTNQNNTSNTSNSSSSGSGTVNTETKRKHNVSKSDHDVTESIATAKKSKHHHQISDNQQNNNNNNNNNQASDDDDNNNTTSNDDSLHTTTTSTSTTNDVSIPSSVSSKHKIIDPFFLEETPEGDLADTTVKHNKAPPQFRVSVGDIKKHAHSGKNRKIIVENDGTMTKQEMRLLNWQMKVRGNQR